VTETTTEATATQGTIGALATEAPARPRLPYNVLEAEVALKRAGYTHAAHLARDEPMAASWLILHTLATKPGIDPDDQQPLNILWRLLRMATIASSSDYDGIIPDDDDRDPTLPDAVGLMLRERALAPDDLPVFASALRNVGLDGMAAAVAAAGPPPDD